MTGVIGSGSLLLVIAWLLAGGLGLPLPEDAALVAAGALAGRGVIPIALAIAIVLICVLAGDIGLFLLARRLGPAAAARRPLSRVLTPARRARIEAIFQKRGAGLAVFIARHVAGLRAATFAIAGMHGMRLRRFVLWDALAACISVPLAVSAGYAAVHLA